MKMSTGVSGSIIRNFEDIKEDLKENLFYLGYHQDNGDLTINQKRLNAKIIEQFKNEFNNKEFPEHYKSMSYMEKFSRISPYYIYGDYDKSNEESLFLSAVTEYTELVGLNLIKYPENVTEISDNDFVYMMVDAEMFSTQSSDLLSLSERLREKYLNIIEKAAQSMLVIGRFNKCSGFPYMMLLGIIKNGNTNDISLKNTFLGLVGNYAYNPEKQHLHKMPESLIGRVFPYEISSEHDEWKNWF